MKYIILPNPLWPPKKSQTTPPGGHDPQVKNRCPKKRFRSEWSSEGKSDGYLKAKSSRKIEIHPLHCLHLTEFPLSFLHNSKIMRVSVFRHLLLFLICISRIRCLIHVKCVCSTYSMAASPFISISSSFERLSASWVHLLLPTRCAGRSLLLLSLSLGVYHVLTGRGRGRS